MSASLCYRFTHRDRAWEIDLMTLSLNDSILLQELTGRTWARVIMGLDEGDAVVVKAVWWSARRASGEDVQLDSDEMNPKWSEFSMRPIKGLSEAAEPEPPDKPAAKPVAKKPAPKK